MGRGKTAGRGKQCKEGAEAVHVQNDNTRNGNASTSNGSTSSVNGPYGLLVPMEIEDAHLKDHAPTVVIYHKSFQRCEADKCQYWWVEKEMEEPHNLLFQMKSYRWGWNAKNSRRYKQNFLSNAYFCINDMSCLEQARRNVKKSDIYMGNFYFQALKQHHVDLLQTYGYWDHILTNRQQLITKCTSQETQEMN